ncbi:hypothetical protein [Streptococcus infantarius]|uniref:hypothetical protein n=1 Tax=Streptococcus infantarius TaxID=102684 RepID=UPI0022E6168D|nr:hypothetical protein [Streptococcus infantarius]
MKLSSFIALGLAGYAGFTAYQAYQKREEIKDDITDANDISDKIASDITKISKAIDNINQQLPKLESISQELDYKRRLFEQESKSRLEQIKTTLSKYQKLEQ